jgi:hypothetical protein
MPDPKLPSVEPSSTKPTEQAKEPPPVSPIPKAPPSPPDKNAGRTRCEVYSRVSGYLRPVRSWNEGKQAEFFDRVTYDGEQASLKVDK